MGSENGTAHRGMGRRMRVGPTLPYQCCTPAPPGPSPNQEHVQKQLNIYGRPRPYQFICMMDSYVAVQCALYMFLWLESTIEFCNSYCG